MGDVVRSGYIKRHSKSFLSGGWNKSFLALHRDSHLCVYKKQGDSTPQGSIFMKDVCKHFAYGEYTNGMPDRPGLPSGVSLDCLMGIPQKPNSKAKIHWFLFNSPSELQEWMRAICSVLPPLPTKASGVPHAPYEAHQVTSHPQPNVPQALPPMGGAPPALGFENLTLGAGPPPPSAYQPVPPSHAGTSYYPQQYPQAPQYPSSHQPYPQQPYHYQPPPGQASPYHQQPVQYVQGQASPYHQQPVQYVQGYPQQAYGYQQPAVIYQTQPVQVVHKHKSGGSNMGKMAAGLAGGALIGYGASRMMGGGWGLGRWGSWSSLSSFGSFGSCGSFGSFGSFD